MDSAVFYGLPTSNVLFNNTFPIITQRIVRNLRRPIAIQEDANVDKYETTYRLLDTEGAGLPSHMGPYHYASHYSNTGIVLHLLVRLPPFTQESDYSYF